MSRPTLVPELYVTDIHNSVHVYRDVLGFTVEYERPEEGFAALSLGGGHLMLEQTSSLRPSSDEDFARGEWRAAELIYPFGRGVNFEFAVADLEAVRAWIIRHDYPIRLDLRERWYRVGGQEAGVRQLLVQDPDGYLLRFQEALGTRSVSGLQKVTASCEV